MAPSEEPSWGDFYENATSLQYFLEHLAYHSRFLEEILRDSPASALEAGCGSAIMSVFLSMSGMQVTACDRDEAVLDIARTNARRWRARVDFLKQDIMELSSLDRQFDVVFSQGVLEHFDDDGIRRLCRESLAVAPVFVFSVPGRFYGTRDFGDERLMNPAEWERVLDGVGRFHTEQYFERRLKRNLLVKRPLMLMGVLRRDDGR